MVNRIFGIGEIVLDVVMRNGMPLAAVPGGSTFNAITSLGRVCPESEICMISQIGEDKVAKLIYDFMADNNVDSRYVKKISGNQTTVSLAFLDEKNDAQYEFFRDSKSPKFQFDDIEFRRDDVILFGSFFAVSNYTREATQYLVRKARDAGAFVYYDINFRKNHINQLQEIKEQIELNCTLSSVVRASSEDLFNLYGTANPDILYKDSISNLCPSFIYTSGAGPVYMYSPNSLRFESLPEKIETVSTIGAGDNFNAGFIYAYTKYGFNIPLLLKSASRFSANVCQSLFNYVDKDFKV